MEAGGQSFIAHLLMRLRVVPSVHQVVVATTENRADDFLVETVEAADIPCFRGSEQDVLDRVLRAGEAFGADVIVEITADCPLIDPEIVEQTVRLYLSNSATYVGNAHVRSFPDGMDTQVFSLEALRTSDRNANDPQEREHVSLHMRRNPEMFPPLHFVAPPALHWPSLGLTLDEADDVDLLRRIVDHFGPKNRLFGCLDIVELLKRTPDWLKINEHVNRRPVE